MEKFLNFFKNKVAAAIFVGLAFILNIICVIYKSIEQKYFSWTYFGVFLIITGLLFLILIGVLTNKRKVCEVGSISLMAYLGINTFIERGPLIRTSSGIACAVNILIVLSAIAIIFALAMVAFKAFGKFENSFGLITIILLLIAVLLTIIAIILTFCNAELNVMDVFDLILVALIPLSLTFAVQE